MSIRLEEKYFKWIDWAIILIFCAIPLFVQLPYKINLYLAWDGAYRMSIGQFPFKDYGMPLGYGFWLIPALFFKIFGPFMSSLIKAQFVLNLASGLAYRHILKVFKVPSPLKTLGILLFSISYIFINFWPWYNHTVFVYEIIALALLCHALVIDRHLRQYWWKLVLAGFLAFLALFTKQDIGGLGLLIILVLLLANNIMDREFRTSLIFGTSFTVAGLIIILPLLSYKFGYWFNHGQDPHSSRVALMDFIDGAFSFESIPIRIYLFAMLIIFINRIPRLTVYLNDKREVLFFLLTLGLLIQPMLGQVTTYIPMYIHYYFHSFALIYILASVAWNVDLYKPVYIGVIALAMLFWFSQDTWRYGKRILYRITSYDDSVDFNEVSKRTWQVPPKGAPSSDRSNWKQSSFKSMDNILLPPETIIGMNKLVSTYKGKKELRVLNLTELPQLAYELGYIPETGTDVPLWYHRNVAIFDRQISTYCNALRDKEYDLVLFENIPSLNGFFAPEIRSCTQEYYHLENSFLAPRIPMDSQIEVYIP